MPLTHRMLTLLTPHGGAEWLPDFLVRDEFITAESAPIATPRTSEPDGETTWTVVQNDGSFNVANGYLNSTAQTTFAWTDLGFYSGADISRANGVALIQLINALNSNWSGAQFGSAAVSFEQLCWWGQSAYGADISDNGIFRVGSLESFGFNFGRDHILGTILRSAGTFFLIDEVIVVATYLTNTATLRAKLVTGGVNPKFDYIRVVQLPAPFADNTLALHADTTPTDGDVITGAQDALHQITWKPSADETLNLAFRRVDDDNCMILRCTTVDGTMKIIRREGGTETQLNSASQSFAAGTTYHVGLRYLGKYVSAWRRDGNTATIANAYNSEVAGCKLSGFSNVSNWDMFPAILPNDVMDEYARYTNPFMTGSGRTKQTITVADGGDIAAAIATMRAGDTLSLAPGGSYTLAAGASGFTGLPSGFWGHKTTVQGNGATITGGKIGLSLTGKKHIHVENLNLIDATERSVIMTNCRWFTLDNIYADSTAGVGLLDVFRFTDGCREGAITNCEAGPSTGWGDHDGFECTDTCGDITFTNCEAHGVIHGFEVWSGAAPAWKNFRITWRNCHSYDNEVGYSCEGGTQSLAHVEIVADNCTAATNSEYDYQGSYGATLYIENDTGGTTNGSVTIRS